MYQGTGEDYLKLPTTNGDDRRSGETDLGGRPHTPEYASPEPITGEPLSVLGANTLSVANLLNNLGVTQNNLGRHDEAERNYRAD